MSTKKILSLSIVERIVKTMRQARLSNGLKQFYMCVMTMIKQMRSVYVAKRVKDFL